MKSAPDRTQTFARFVVAALALCLSCARPARAQAVDRLDADFHAITDFGDRLPGSPGYEKTRDYLRAQLAALPGVEVREHAYDVMVPRTTRAAIRFADGRDVPLAAFWPAHVRLNATPAEGFAGKLVYSGDCEYDKLKPLSLRGNIAVVEASARERWTRAFYFGARAIVVLPDPAATNADYRAFDLRPPANLPRFYLADEALAKRLRAGEDVGNVTLTASANWVKTRATNFYALLTPRGGTRPLREGDANKPAAATFVVNYDSSSIVADAAPGASQAANVAAALSMARDLATAMQADPADSSGGIKRPVMFAFTGADGIAQLGTRNMLLALAEAPATWAEEATTLDAELAKLRGQAQRLTDINGQPWTLDPTRDRELIQRLITLVETDLSIQQDKLFRLRVLPADATTDATRAQQKAYEENQITLAGVRSSLQTDPRGLERPERKTLAAYYATLALERLQGSKTEPVGLIDQRAARREVLKTRGDLYAWLADRTGRPAAPAERDTSGRLLEVTIGLDLSDRGSRVGPVFVGGLIKYSSKINIQPYGQFFTLARNAAEKGDASAAWFKPLAGIVDVETLNTSRTAPSYIGATPLLSEYASSWGVAGFTMATLDDFRLLRDTPNDTAANVNLDAIRPQVAALSTLFGKALASDRFVNDGEIRRNRNSFAGQVVGTAPGKPVPDLPLEGYLVSYTFTANKSRVPSLQPTASYATGVRRYEVVDTDVEGKYRIEGLSRYPTNPNFLTAFVQCFFMEKETGAIQATTDLGKASGDISPLADLTTNLNPLRSLPFDCDEVSLVGVYDPRFLQSLGEIQIIDARRNTDAPRMSATLFERVLAAFVEPASRNYFLFRYGQIGNRLVLLNMPEDLATASDRDAKLGRGFTTRQIDDLGPLSVQTANDFAQLDAKRLADYRQAGVSSALIDSLHAESKQQLIDARKALANDDAPGAVKNGNGAWATEALVYSASKAMASDVVRAAIFLLLLAVPFSVCMERLLIASPNVYKQIAGIAGIFALMTGALWAFHPAFQITSSPLIIILSFAIIFMSIIVIGVVYQKFDAELKVIRSGRGHSEGASFLRASVLTNAVMLGIANMRKRKIRTTLTATTIVLITFAVLVFASAASFRSTTSLPTGVNSDHPGLLLRQRGYRPMPIDIASELRVLFPQTTVVERWWNANATDPNETNLVIAGSGASIRTSGLPAILGLSPGESKLSRIADVIGAEKFARLENGENNIIYLSRATADELKVKEGDSVRIGGLGLTIAGVYDGAEFDRKVFTLSGEGLAPLKFETNALDAGGRKLSDTAAESITLDADGGGAELASVYQHLPGAQIAIVPARVSQQLNNARLASVALRMPDETVVVDNDGKLVTDPAKQSLDDNALAADRLSRVKRVKWAADEVARRFTIVTYAGLDDGVQMISSSTPTKITGSQVAIPLLIGGLIIFNTMMGSIAERKREIHVYTSLGLAPLHVGALFVAEALTYGVIGTVFGYICGQGLGTALLKLGLLGNMTLDYSGTSALLTIGLVLAVVVLSALVPARLASKIASPSIERSWRVPTPVDGQIMATLPFTINRTAAEGVVAYLAEYFESHKEGSIGKFAADDVTAFAWTGEETESGGKPSRGVQTTIWLTPFDLGVRQHLMLLIHPGTFPDIYEVQVLLNRMSGDDGSWYRMNRSFLTELRKQFLQWRSLSPARMREYVEQSKSLFGTKV